MGNNSIGKTLLVAVSLCIFFSVIVSSAAVGLKPLQLKNRDLDMKKNILSSAGIKATTEEEINDAFSQVQTLYVLLPSGEVVDMKPSEAAEKKKMKIDIKKENDIAKIGTRPKYVPVYLIKKDEKVDKIVLPIISKGLWSTMYAFMALEGDANTIAGLEYYIQGETPGLGAEVTNPKWKSQWPGKKVYENGDVEIDITKPGMAKNENYEVDGLSGATITSDGVENSLKYWLGENGYKNFLAKVSGGEL